MSWCSKHTAPLLVMFYRRLINSAAIELTPRLLCCQSSSVSQMPESAVWSGLLRSRRILCRGANGAESCGVAATAVEVSPGQLKAQLTKPLGWGPTEWGPIPFLPSPAVLVSRMEKQWGPLDSYRGLATTAGGGPSSILFIPVRILL